MSIIPEHFWSCSGGDEQLVTYIRVGDKMTASQCSYGKPDETVPEKERVEFAITFRPLLEPGGLEGMDQYDPHRPGCCIAFKDEAALDTIINQIIDLKGCLNESD